MRRAYLLSLGFIALVLLALLVMLARSLWPAPGPEQTSTSAHETLAAINQTIYAPGGITGVGPYTASPTVNPAMLPQTAEAYATAHADAPGLLEVTTMNDELTYSVTFDEVTINGLIAPYAAEVGGVDNVRLRLLPEGGTLTADFHFLGMTVQVEAAADLAVEAGLLTMEVLNAAIGGITPPAAAIEAVKADLVTMVSSALHDGLAAYGPVSAITLTGITILSEQLNVTFRLHEPYPRPEPTTQ